MTDSVKIERPPHDPIASTLSAADDRIVMSEWLPPQEGIVPRIRIGRRWINILWALPIGAAALVLLIALAQSLREFQSVQAFIKEYPGIAQAAPSVDSGFPWWLQLQHFLNMLFMMFIIRAGIQILADHPRLWPRGVKKADAAIDQWLKDIAPSTALRKWFGHDPRRWAEFRLYWTRDCTPGTEWFRFQYPVPEGRIWTSKDDLVTVPGWLGIPGVRHSIGLARWWHFSVVMLWTLNGIAFYLLIFATGQWLRLVPVTWGVFPAALSTALQYASLNFPVDESWTRYNGLQQLSYFITVFIAAPVSLLTGLMQNPAISNRLGLLGTVLNWQAARSIHFISFCWFVLFILAHGIMVFVTERRADRECFGRALRSAKEKSRGASTSPPTRRRGANHHPLLHPGMVRRRQVGRRSDARHP